MSEGCDVLLRTGGIAHVRPLVPGDLAQLHDLVDRTSERSAYLRFFTGGRASAHTYMDRLTQPAYRGHALIAIMGGRVTAIGEYIPISDGAVADMAILLDDVVQGQGLGTILLEHLADHAARQGVRELVAEVLAVNSAMLRVLRDLGLAVDLRYDGSTVEVKIQLEPTPRLLAGIQAREHEAERASLARILAPGSVAVVGAGRDPSDIGHKVLRNLLDGGFAGRVYPVNPHATEVAGVRAYPGLAAVPGPVDLAVVAVPAQAVPDVAVDCAAAGVKGLVVLSAGQDPELLRICRSAGMRLIGPDSLGIVNTSVRLNAGFLPGPPTPGTIALMSQSGAVGAALLARLAVSSLVSVGDKADVSGNDLLEYWEDDEATEVIALYLESFGNPRKFARIAARVGRRKPVLLVKSGRSGSGGRVTRSGTASAATPDIAVDALVRASGVIRVDTIRDLIDTARLLAAQPLPAGRRVAIVGNSGGPEAMAADACERSGLVVPELAPVAGPANPIDLTADATAEQIGLAVETALREPDVDAVLVVYTPPFGSGADATRKAIAEATRTAGKTVVACVMGEDGMIEDRVPSYAFPEQAVQALARAVSYAEWRRAAEPVAEQPPADEQTARELVAAELARRPDGGWLEPDATDRLLRCFGVTTAGTAPADGIEIIVGGVNYPAFGPLVMVGMGGVAADLIADRAFRVPPLTPAAATEMIGELRCSPLLYGYRDSPRADVAALVRQVVGVGHLLDALPEVAELDLNPVVVTPRAAVAVHARIRLAPADPPPSPYTRRLR
ncbi:bifunctional acetate--CoA ligase family protein/GNAT family N-acetyltransferase [Acrocarpospora catenulata]|uniref:bifunctional acetate--CoA ligase family protein/GNAT family N-acetyltransferase n=1 Tax=Acrocarpospora catenulata TaxID=2836182 RepID=UPI001BDA34B9|nr:GNAT family N-acetyltransferase [Acrocarpospora catenulata]